MSRAWRNRRRAQDLDEQVSAWNAANPIGTKVILTRDNGTEEHTATRSAAWVLSGHTAVVMVDGRSGCYLLDRIRPEPPTVEPHRLLTREELDQRDDRIFAQDCRRERMSKYGG